MYSHGRTGKSWWLFRWHLSLLPSVVQRYTSPRISPVCFLSYAIPHSQTQSTSKWYLLSYQQAQQHWTVWNSPNTPYILLASSTPCVICSLFLKCPPHFCCLTTSDLIFKNPSFGSHSWHPYSPLTAELPLLLVLPLFPGLLCTLLLLLSLHYLSGPLCNCALNKERKYVLSNSFCLGPSLVPRNS